MGMQISGWPYFCFSQQMHFLLGCSLGITLSLILMPVLEEHCMYNIKEYRDLSRPSLQTDIEMDDYEPVHNINPNKKKAERGKYQLSRPRYYSTELNIREKLYVAVFSSSSSILSVGSALNRTLSKHADKIVFYVDGIEAPKASDSSIVTFPDKNGVVAPFYMLQHIADNFLNDYDFFFFVKDSTHVRGHKLNEFVHHISVSQSVHVGKSVDIDSLYCSLDGGIILSSNVLRATVEDLDWCIQHAFSDKASDNFGRCILHGTRLPCSSRVQGLQYVSHPLTEHVGLDISILKSSWTKDLKYALTLHPILNANDHYVIHNYFCQQELIDNQHDLEVLQNEILSVNRVLQNDSHNDWPVGIEPPFSSRSRFDVISWVYFNESHSLFMNEQTGLQRLNGLHKAETVDILHSAVNWVQNRYKDRLIFQKLLSGYKRFDPTRGTEYFMDLLFLEDSSGQKTVKRINAIRPLNKVEIIPVPFVTEHSRIVLLLIIQPNQNKEVLYFLEEYAKNCLEKQGSTVLLLVFLYAPQDLDDAFDSVKNRVNILLYKYKSTGAKIAWLSMRTYGRIPPKFAIIDIVSKKLALDSMVLLCGVSMEIHADFLNRVRMNTIQKSQVFFPVPYVQYHPSISYGHVAVPEGVEVKKNYGHFDYHNFEYTSFYLSDYLTVRKLFEYKIPLLRSDKDLHDETLYNLPFDLSDMFLKSKLHVMRAAEPDLRVRFNFAQLCEPELPKAAYSSCLENVASKLGSKSQLAALILSQSTRDRNTNSEK